MSCTSVWGNQAHHRMNSFTTDRRRTSLKTDSLGQFICYQAEQNRNNQKIEGTLSFGSFGSKPVFGSGPSSLPAIGSRNENSNIYKFELGTNSPGSGHLSLGMESKQFWSINNPFCPDYNMDTSCSSGGSSRYSSNNGSTGRLDWGAVVEGVYREEIGKMAQEIFWGSNRNSSQ